MQTAVSQTPGWSDTVIRLRERVARSCELLQKGTLLYEQGYIAVRVEGGAQEIYSPELGKDDFIEYPTDTLRNLVKLAQSSGFRVNPLPDAKVKDLPRLIGEERDSSCPTLEAALHTAEQNRQNRRRHVQSKVYRAGFDRVSRPEVLENPQPSTEAQDATKSSQAGPRPIRREGTTILSFVVMSNGNVEQVKVVRSFSTELDQKAVQAVSGWKFKPARKDGLPVPVLIDTEVTFHPY